MIVKDLMNCGRETQHRLRELEVERVSDSAELDFLRRKMSALCELQNYFYNGDWTRKASREKYIALVKSKFDYELTAARFNTTRESIDVFAARQNKRLEYAIGAALRLIEQDRVEEGLDCFYAATGEFSEEELNYSISELLKMSQKDRFLVSDCAEEVKILRSLMKSTVRKRLSGADCGKLSYLVFLLNTKEEAFRQQRAGLIGELRKKDSQCLLKFWSLKAVLISESAIDFSSSVLSERKYSICIDNESICNKLVFDSVNISVIEMPNTSQILFSILTVGFAVPRSS